MVTNARLLWFLVAVAILFAPSAATDIIPLSGWCYVSYDSEFWDATIYCDNSFTPPEFLNALVGEGNQVEHASLLFNFGPFARIVEDGGGEWSASLTLWRDGFDEWWAPNVERGTFTLEWVWLLDEWDDPYEAAHIRMVPDPDFVNLGDVAQFTFVEPFVYVLRPSTVHFAQLQSDLWTTQVEVRLRVVPEPATLVLLGLGTVVAFARRAPRSLYGNKDRR